MLGQANTADRGIDTMTHLVQIQKINNLKNIQFRNLIICLVK